MTLCISTTIDGIPINFSDIMISARDTESKHINIPTDTKIDQIIPESWSINVVDLVRKTYIISNNLIVSWSGEKITAEYILKELYLKYSNSIVNHDDLIDFLKSHNDLKPNFVELVINLKVNNDNFTFKWNSIENNIIKYDNTCITGSGESYYSELLKCSKSFLPKIENKSNAMKIILSAFCSIFFVEEWYLGMNLPHFFGGGFEAGFFNNNKFELIDNYSIMLWTAMKRNGETIFAPYGEYYRFYYTGNILCIKKYENVLWKPPPDEIPPGPKIFLINPLVGQPDIEIFKEHLKNLKNKNSELESSIYIHVLIADAILINPLKKPEGRFMILHYELPHENAFFRAIEMNNVLKIYTDDNKIPILFNNLLKHESLDSLKLFTPSKFAE